MPARLAAPSLTMCVGHASLRPANTRPDDIACCVRCAAVLMVGICDSVLLIVVLVVPMLS